MSFLQVKNNAASKLAAAIDDDDLSLTVAAGEGARFPASNFHVTIEDEILLCSSRTNDVLTVTRAQEDTAAAAHALGKAVRLNITAAIIEELQLLSKVVWLDAPVPKTLADQTSDVNYTDWDLTADTSPDAKLVILNILIAYEIAVAGTFVFAGARKNGTTPTHYPRCWIPANANAGSYFENTSIVALDSGQILEYKIDSDNWGGGRVDVYLNVLGYIE